MIKLPANKKRGKAKEKMPKDEIKAMYKAEGAGFLNVSERGTGHYNEVAIIESGHSYTPDSCSTLSYHH